MVPLHLTWSSLGGAFGTVIIVSTFGKLFERKIVREFYL